MGFVVEIVIPVGVTVVNAPASLTRYTTPDANRKLYAMPSVPTCKCVPCTPDTEATSVAKPGREYTAAPFTGSGMYPFTNWFRTLGASSYGSDVNFTPLNGPAPNVRVSGVGI